MYVQILIVTLLGLTQAQTCAFTEQRWEDDESCSGTPIYDEVLDGEINECVADDADPGSFGLISECSGGTFVWKDYDEDDTCGGDKTSYNYASGECAFEYEEDGVKYYAIITITGEEKATFAAVAWASLFIAMMIVNV